MHPEQHEDLEEKQTSLIQCYNTKTIALYPVIDLTF